MSHAMNQSFTAEDLFAEMKRMTAVERTRFFSLLTGNAFRDDDFSHEQVFGHLQHEPFSAWEAAEYLEVSLPTLRRRSFDLPQEQPRRNLRGSFPCSAPPSWSLR
jgi:hypothetical protein